MLLRRLASSSTRRRARRHDRIHASVRLHPWRCQRSLVCRRNHVAQLCLCPLWRPCRPPRRQGTRPRRYALVVRSLFVIGACALLCVQLLLFAAQWTSMSRDLPHRSLLCLMIFAGAGSSASPPSACASPWGERARCRAVLRQRDRVLPPRHLVHPACSRTSSRRSSRSSSCVPACVACIAIFACARFRPADRLLVDGLIAHQTCARQLRNLCDVTRLRRHYYKKSCKNSCLSEIMLHFLLLLGLYVGASIAHACPHCNSYIYFNGVEHVRAADESPWR